MLRRCTALWAGLPARGTEAMRQLLEAAGGNPPPAAQAAWRRHVVARYQGTAKVDRAALQQLLDVIQAERGGGGLRGASETEALRNLFALNAGEGDPARRVRIPEDVVTMCLQRCVQRVRMARRRDVTCYPGSQTARHLREGYALFNWFRQDGCELQLRSWTLALQMAGVARHSGLTRMLLSDMLRAGVKPDAYVLGIVLSSFTASSYAKPEVISELRRNCLRTWADFLSLGVEPDATCYVQMIRVLSSFGDSIHAEQLFAEMQAKGLNAVPNLRVYTALLAGVQTEERLHSLLREMADKGLQLDPEAFVSVLGCLRRLGGGSESAVQKAEAVFQSGLDDGVAMDEYAFCALLLVYREARAIKKAASLVAKMMKKFNIEPREQTVNHLLETASLCVGSRNDDAWKAGEWAWQYSRLKKCRTVHTYGFMLAMCCRAGEYERAVEVFVELTKSPTRVLILHYERVLEAYVKLGRTREADALRRLPRYRELLSEKERISAGRPRKRGGPEPLLIPREMRSDVSPADVGSKPERKLPPQAARRDRIASSLAEAADGISTAAGPHGQKRFALDDVLGL